MGFIPMFASMNDQILPHMKRPPDFSDGRFAEWGVSLSFADPWHPGL